MIKNKFPEYVKEYLQKSLNPIWRLETSPEKLYDNIIVVPAIQEKENIKLLLGSLANCDNKYFNSTLVMFVVNALSNSSNKILEENLDTLDYLRKFVQKNFDDDKLLMKLNSLGLNIGVVDATSHKKTMPTKEGGVGFARKIGMDLALQYFDYHSSNKKLIISLDADCTVEPNYLTEIVEYFNKCPSHCAYVKFEHPLPDDEQLAKAAINYEIFLRYYVLGLKYANSPYAYHSIGSTIICDAESYIKVGGMSKNKAGEDFYFLEKLAKITTVEEISATKVYPSARSSWRVPFGTGQRIGRFLSNNKNEYILYDPQTFFILKEWISEFHSNTIYNADNYLQKAKRINNALHDFLIQNSFDITWNKILKNSKSERQIQNQKKLWFDAFKTLKLIHFLRDTSFPSINMFDALDIILNKYGINCFRRANEVIPPIEIQLKYLSKLRELT
ncbi:hypothetical protein ABRY23_11335 [Melioribacteraceae bacterium 4301-Me]|uniref:hypothetical protein n=1 Tax=Pyranulibacter aquaticus TaxID=3163344 RepID=UPI003594C78D